MRASACGFDLLYATQRVTGKVLDALGQLARETDGFSGAEIEQVIIAALYDAFDDGERELNMDGLKHAIAATVPLSRTMREQVNGLRNWARTHARQASRDPQAQVAWASA